MIRMWHMYQEKSPDLPVSLCMFRKIFNGNFNIYFKPPEKDTCSYCDLMAKKISTATDDQKEELVVEVAEHHQQAKDLQKVMKDLMRVSFSFGPSAVESAPAPLFDYNEDDEFEF